VLSTCVALTSGDFHVLHKLALATLFALSPIGLARADGPTDIGSRLELFVENSLIERVSPPASLHQHEPVPREVVLVTSEPWEGNTSANYTVFPDGDIYRMYYRAAHSVESPTPLRHPDFTCYAESQDGIHWSKPKLGLFEFYGSTDNNIIWKGNATENFTPFKDPNPDCAPDARYKAVGGVGEAGLFAFKSSDGIRWSRLSEKPVITQGAFDSQNVAFWDPIDELYRDFHRKPRDGHRDIMTCTSKDFVTWTEPVFLEYPGAPQEHLYTNGVRPYFRAPHILLGFPARYQPKNSQVEPILMASRDRRTFQRWPQALIPITAPKDRDWNRSNYMSYALVPLEDNEREVSVYAHEAYAMGPNNRLRRFTFRTDGFVSVRSGDKPGELLTKPVTFVGDHLEVNFVTRHGGKVRVELQDAGGSAIAGYALADCKPLTGDEISQTVSWKNGPAVGSLAGKPVRLRFELKNADIFSYRFRE
jgi:hypothetical protein